MIVTCFCETGFPNCSDVEYTRDESADNDDDIGLPELAQELQIELDEHVDDDVPTEDNSENWERALVDQCDMTYKEVLKIEDICIDKRWAIFATYSSPRKSDRNN